mmetsp:Transcript_103330/g.267237  ORF Transcript_103330/g.267237 Transcript_103330/m.267237 type:complete len:303 (+) Transcript_103330:331-1239(+)
MRRAVQRGAASRGLHHAGVSAMAQQHRAETCPALLGSHVQRRLAFSGSQIDVGTRQTNQVTHSHRPPLGGSAGRHVQGAIAVRIHLVEERVALANEHLHTVRLRAGSRHMQRQAPVSVRTVGKEILVRGDGVAKTPAFIDLGRRRMACKEHADALHVPLSCRMVERGPPVRAAAAVEPGAGRHQVLQALDVASPRRQAGWWPIEEGAARRVGASLALQQQPHYLGVAPASRSMQWRQPGRVAAVGHREAFEAPLSTGDIACLRRLQQRARGLAQDPLLVPGAANVRGGRRTTFLRLTSRAVP